MLEDVIHLPPQPPQQSPPPPPPQAEQLPNIADISSPISAHILEFCESELFQETLQNSEVTSSSNCCYEENSSYATNIPIALDVDKKFNTNGNIVTTPSSTAATSTSTSTTTTTAATTNNHNTTTAATTNNHNTTTTNNTHNLPIIFDSPEDIDNDISASIDFSSSQSFQIPPFIPISTQQEQFDFSNNSLQQPQLSLAAVSVVEGLSQYTNDPVGPLMGGPLPSVFEEDCLSSVPSYAPLNPNSPSCSYLSPGIGVYMPPGPINTALSADSSTMFGGSILLAPELQPQELDFQGDNGGIYCPDAIQRVFNPPDLQALSTESQQLVAGAGSSTTLTPEISNLEDSSYKVGKLSVEQRKEKIHRYMKKRNERNFSKKIKYACRKTLADSRPRVRGRFAKNDDFGENHRPGSSNHEEDEEEEVVVKEEDDMVDSSDIFAHISGVNSFKCNYSIQSWI